ncbi:MAG: hypothetical protein ABI397_03260 [Candidatus Saccharimonas sp.]
MPNLPKFMQPDDAEFHSHSMAKADPRLGSTMGSNDNSTFEERKSIEQNRQIVSGYNSAGLIGTYREEARIHPTNGIAARRRQYAPNRASGVTRQNASLNPGAFPNSQSGAIAPPPAAGPSFKEPSPRRYNPYG